VCTEAGQTSDWAALPRFAKALRGGSALRRDEMAMAKLKLPVKQQMGLSMEKVK